MIIAVLFCVSCRYLPLYLVAAFVKKLSRLALFAPPEGETFLGVYVSVPE
jgi:hypothetical protein